MNQSYQSRPTQKKRKIWPIVLGLLILVPLAAFFLGAQWYRDAISEVRIDMPTEFTVQEGESFKQVAERLENEGVITSALALGVYIRIEGISPAVKVGTYLVQPETDMRGLIALLETGGLREGVFVTIKEGLRYEEVAAVFKAELGGITDFDATAFGEIVESPQSYEFSPEVSVFLQEYLPAGLPLRGLLYPDTYRVDIGMTEIEVVDAMLQNFIIRTKEARSNFVADEEIASFYEAVVLASIVEKEASAWDDRAEIAGVFHNRLEQGSLLQSDATVNFVTGENEAGVDLVDTQIDSPYNTYRYPGLPPTPINNPRFESIDAAVFPNSTEYLFFYHTPDGRTFYNTNFADHQSGVCRDLGC